jgi:hypothetical protein
MHIDLRARLNILLIFIEIQFDFRSFFLNFAIELEFFFRVSLTSD